VGHDEPTVTGSQVHRRRGVGRGEIGQLADVHLGEAAPGQDAHEPMIALAVMAPTVQTVTVRDIDVHVVRVGSGRPLVVCGGPQLGHQYLRALDALADQCEVIYYDARGSGGTEVGDPSQISFAGALEDLEGLRQALGIEQWSILGHSLGGHLAYLYASRHADRVESLIVVDAGPPLTEELATQLSEAMEADRTEKERADLKRAVRSDAVRARQPKAIEDFILAIYAPFFRDRNTITNLDLGFTDITAANVLGYEETLVASLPDQDPFVRLSEISRPTLVIHGEGDPIPVESSQLLVDQIPGAELVVIPDGGHFPFIENAADFQLVVREFLSRTT
jgi:proline-specific peptidase